MTCSACDGSGRVMGRIPLLYPAFGSEPGWVPCRACKKGRADAEPEGTLAEAAGIATADEVRKLRRLGDAR